MSFRRYESYRDSGVEWSGQLPSHWQSTRLRFVTDLNPSKSEVSELPDEQELNFLPMEAVGEKGELDLSRTRPVGELRNGYSYFADGDVVFAKVTPCLENGKGALIAGLIGGKGFGTTELTVLRPHDGADGPFLRWLTSSQVFRGPAEGEMVGAGGLKRVPDDFVADFPAPWPPTGERRDIAAFLDRETAKIDALVQTQRHLIELLTEKRQAVISHAVTKGLDPSAPMKDSGVEWLGGVPAHWEVDRIANLFGESVALLSEDLPILSVSIHNGVSDEELDEDDLERKVSRSEDRGKYKRVRPGDLVYNMMRAWQGGFGTVSVDGGVSPAYVVARPKVDIETAFVEWVLRTPQCVEEMRTRSVGVTDFRLRLYWDEFKDLKIALPPLAEQRQILAEIGEEIERYRKLAETAEAAVALLSERRAALISAAVTGKIDVRGWTATEVRTAVAAEIIRLHARKPTFGRVKNQKLLYLAEAHAGITEIGGRYERKAAGPYDADLIALVERDLEAAGVMTVSQPEGTGSTVSYSLNRSWKPDSERLKAMLGGRLAAFEQVNAKLAELKTREAEAVATLYAVWNDALIDGEACDDARVIRGFFDEWHPEKREKFKQAELHTWLGWMRRNGMLPSGRGPRTGIGGLFG